MLLPLLLLLSANCLLQTAADEAAVAPANIDAGDSTTIAWDNDNKDETPSANPDLAEICKNDSNQCSGANEQLKCVQDCPPQKTCRNRDIRFSCLAVVTPCSNQCVCNGDLVINSKNECVRVEDCDENAAIPYKS